MRGRTAIVLTLPRVILRATDRVVRLRNGRKFG